MTADIKLPPLPDSLRQTDQPIWHSIVMWLEAKPGAAAGKASKRVDAAVADAMRAYATTAILADRERTEGVMRMALEALRNGASVCASVSTSHDRRVKRDGSTLYLQTDDWCHWAEHEVGPEIQTAIAALREHLKEMP